MDLSVIIPARNEKFLQATIDDILQNFTSDLEIIVGLDDYDPDPPLRDDPKVKVWRADERVGMRPMINRLAKMAAGKYLMKVDAHCSFDTRYDAKLIETHQTGYTVLGVRYLLDTPTWSRRKRTNCDFRYLSNPDVDPKGGLRGEAWHELKDRYKGKQIAPTMSIAGSNWLMERSQFEKWGGLDENHGTFGQEGAEISLKTWLSGGQVLVDRRTWYAHWNRGKAPYALGRHQRDKSVAYSCELWLNNRWEQQTHAFRWLLEKFAPVPGWTLKEAKKLKAPRQGTFRKGFRKKHGWGMPVDELWDKWENISDRPKRYRLLIQRQCLADLFRRLTDGETIDRQNHPYANYLRTHLNESIKGTAKGERRVRWKMNDAIALFSSVKKKGLLAPLEFYQDDGGLILYKGYRRLALLKALGVPEVACMVHLTNKCKDLPAMFPNEAGPIVRAASEQFSQLGGRATDKYWVHGYTAIYDRLFADLLPRKLRLLELGAYHGASLALWHTVFPKAEIVSVDRDGESWKDLAGGLDRVSVMVGNQRDNDFMQTVAKRGWHIVIDDCSHDPRIQRTTFDAIWPSVKAGGLYVIEDCHYSYNPRYKVSFVEHLASMVPQIYTSCDIAEVQFFYNLCVVRKGWV